MRNLNDEVIMKQIDSTLRNIFKKLGNDEPADSILKDCIRELMAIQNPEPELKPFGYLSEQFFDLLYERMEARKRL